MLSQTYLFTEECSKDDYLRSISSPKTKYKRVALSPIRYPGGKSLAVGHILEHLPEVKRVISPFFGGGSVEIAMAQKLGIPIIAGDIDSTLVNYWHYQLNQPADLVQALSQLRPNLATYNRIKDICKRWRKKEIQLTELELATYFYFNHALSYGPSFIGWASQRYLNEDVYQRLLHRVAHFEADIQIKHASFEYFFEKYPNDFFYCDPPYFLKTDDETSKMFNGVYPERNRPIYHNSFDHDKLRDCLVKHKGGFILSYNDCAKSREYYKDFKLVYPQWQYTMGQGETRISEVLGNRSDSHIKASHELLAICPCPRASAKLAQYD